jgi:hypothetical protein
MRERLYTGDHPDIATSLFSLAKLYSRLNEKDKAVKLFKKSLEIRQRLYDDNHPDVIETIDFIAKFND